MALSPLAAVSNVNDDSALFSKEKSMNGTGALGLFDDSEPATLFSPTLADMPLFTATEEKHVSSHYSFALSRSRASSLSSVSTMSDASSPPSTPPPSSPYHMNITLPKYEGMDEFDREIQSILLRAPAQKVVELPDIDEDLDARLWAWHDDQLALHQDGGYEMDVDDVDYSEFDTPTPRASGIDLRPPQFDILAA